MKDNHIYRHYCILTCPTSIMVLEFSGCPEKVTLSPSMNHFIMALYKILSGKVTQGTETTEE